MSAECHPSIEAAHCSKVIFGPFLNVFPAKEKAGTIPFFATAPILVAYRRDRPHRREYLDAIEKAPEDVAPPTEEVIPALILLARRTRALQERHDLIRKFCSPTRNLSATT